MSSRFLVLFLVGVVVAACGDAESTTTSSSGAVTTAATAAVTATTAPAATVATPSTTAPSTTAAPPSSEVTVTVTVPVVETGWFGLGADAGGPEARSNAVLVYTPAEDALYLHGGRTDGAARTDLWRYDLGTADWAEVNPGGDVPEVRYSHTAIWDEVRDRLVVFSGQAGPGRFLSDVWAYDAATNTWIELAPNRAGPENRYGSCAGYDPVGDRFLISHGFTDNGRFDDTWVFDLGGNTWTDVSPGENRPLRRCLHTCTYDPENAALVLFGGQSNEQFAHDDAWILSADTWSEVPATGPAARKFPSSVPLGGETLIFGGKGEDVFGDMWALDTADAAWTPADLDGAPAARHSHAAAYDGAAGRMWVFGGEIADGSESADLWVLLVP